ncbi:CHAP domain-containing protein [Oscillospiraceae bacterium 38-13]
MLEQTAVKEGGASEKKAVLPADVLIIAQQELGTEEAPPSSNRVKYNTWYYGREVSGKAYPWCMVFVQWCFAQAGLELPLKTASCSALLDWFTKNRPDQVSALPLPGDIVIYEFGHTGIVESAGSGVITAIEGNTSPGSSGSQTNGGMVARRTRSASLAKKYIRPDYGKEETQMDNTPSPAHWEGVEWAQKNGIITGNEMGDLHLTDPITRQQACTMLYRLAKLMGKV